MLILSLIANLLSLMAQSAAVSPARIMAARYRPQLPGAAHGRERH